MMQEKFIDKLQKIISTCNSEGMYRGNYIPENKLSNAIKHFSFDTTDTPLALIDTTVFGSAKLGMIIGHKGIYFKNDWNVESVRNFLSWQEIAESDFKIRKKTFEIEILPNCNFGMSAANMKRDALIDLLTEITESYNNM